MNPLPPSELQVRKPDVLAARPVGRVREPHAAPAHGVIGMTDILFALYKHKKKIILFTAFGLLVAATVYAMYPAPYESQAKLLVRYVVERSTVDALDATSSSGMSSNADAVIASEIEILTSWDLAIQVAEAIGPKRMLPHSKAPPTKEAAAATIAKGLDATSHRGGNIIFVSYKNGDPELATLVLTELVNRYFNKHLEVHRSAGAFDFVTQQTDQVRARLNQTEDALKEIKDKAGIISLESATTALGNEEDRTEEQLHAAEAELAEQQARVKQLGGVIVELLPAASPSTTATDKAKPANEIPTEVAEQYQSLVTRLPQLRQSKMETLAKYTAESQTVKSIQNEINDVEIQRRSLEAKYPDLPSRVGGVSLSRGQALDPASETARLAGLVAKKNALAARLHDIRTRIQQVTQLSPQIADLERERQLEETNYKYFQGTLEKARIDEALDPSKIPNITAVQRPSPPAPMTRQRDKLVAGLTASGLAVGVAFALLKELVLNRNVRSPSEVERVAGTSALMSIPYCNGNSRPAKKRPRRADETAGVVDIVGMRSSNGGIAPWDPGHFIREYSDAIRDRLGLYFELHQLTHKPKLVGVAGLKQGAGTSTLAAGLAAALSETNDGKVLLVDVNLGPEHVHPFFRGKPAYPLNTALRPPTPIDAAAENLYLATVGSSNAGPAQLGLKKFFDLMPNLKASDFDYIIFDMPPLTSTSPTWGISPFMDKLLLVVEAERDNREVLRRSYQKLRVERDNVSVVLNKTQSYGSRLLEVEG
jgi:succinoglycan biosynthesis transport protein ExoP